MKCTFSVMAVWAVVACWAGNPSSAAAADDAWGTVKGQIVFDGENVPAPMPINVNKDQQHCLGKGPIVSEEWVVDPASKGVRWTYVWLVDASDPKKLLPIHPKLKEIKKKEVVLDQPTCQFVPHAVGIRQGQDLVAKNSATIAHNVHWTGLLKNPGGNVIVPAGQSYVIRDLLSDRLPVKINCDIHGWMTASVFVFDHPYFAVTDKKGNFELKNAPAGKYRLMVLHDTGYGPGGRKGTEITIKGGEATDVGKIALSDKK